MTIRFVLKNGKEIDMKCEKFVANTNQLLSNGMITGYQAKGITENKIIGIDFSEVVAVYRLITDELADKIGDEKNKMQELEQGSDNNENR